MCEHGVPFTYCSITVCSCRSLQFGELQYMFDVAFHTSPESSLHPLCVATIAQSQRIGTIVVTSAEDRGWI